jgi:hypothetical protein
MSRAVSIDSQFAKSEDGNGKYLTSSVENTSLLSPSGKFSLTNLSTWSTKMIILMVSLALFFILIPLVFTIVIPSFIVDSCEKADISIQKATFINPSDSTFRTSIDLKFSSGVSISSQVDIHDMKVSWNDLGGGRVLKLNHINQLAVTTSSQTMHAMVQVSNLTALTDFASSIMISDKFQLDMKGDATVTVIVPADVTLDKSSQLLGFGNWSTDATIPTLNITNGTSEYLTAISVADLTSTSNLEIIFGQNVYYKLKVHGDVFVGLGTFTNFTLFTGNFSDMSTINLYYTNPKEYDGLMYLIGNYMSRVDTPVVVNDLYLENTVKWLQPALSSIQIHAVIPGLSTNLVMYADMYVSVKNPLKVPFTLTLFNPLIVPVLFDTMDADIYYEGRVIAVVQATNLQVLVPPGSQVTTQEIESQVDPRETSTVLALLDAGYGLIDCYAVITIYIVEFKATVNYFQTNISAYIHPPRGTERGGAGGGEGMWWREEGSEKE